MALNLQNIETKRNSPHTEPDRTCNNYVTITYSVLLFQSTAPRIVSIMKLEGVHVSKGLVWHFICILCNSVFTSDRALLFSIKQLKKTFLVSFLGVPLNIMV